MTISGDKIISGLLMVAGLAKHVIRGYLAEKDDNRYKLSCKQEQAKKINVGDNVEWRPAHQYCQNPNQTITLNVISPPQQAANGQSSFYCVPQASAPLQLQTCNGQVLNAPNYSMANKSNPEFLRFIDGNIADATYKANAELTISGYGDLGEQLITNNTKTLKINEKTYILTKVLSSIKDNCRHWQIVLAAE